jgi:hypothetical protein
VSVQDAELRTQVLLSLQRALWGVITPDIRAIAVGWSQRIVRVRFLYDHSPTDADREVVGEVETDVVADLPVGIPTEFTADFVPEGKPALSPEEGWWAYMRRED